MTDVVIDKDAMEKSKIHSTIVEKIRKTMINDLYPTRPRPGGRKWEEIIKLNGAKYAVHCRWEDGKVVMTNVRVSPTRKIKIHKK